MAFRNTPWRAKSDTSQLVVRTGSLNVTVYESAPGARTSASLTEDATTRGGGESMANVPANAWTGVPCTSDTAPAAIANVWVPTAVACGTVNVALLAEVRVTAVAATPSS